MYSLNKGLERKGLKEGSAGSISIINSESLKNQRRIFQNMLSEKFWVNEVHVMLLIFILCLTKGDHSSMIYSVLSADAYQALF